MQTLRVYQDQMIDLCEEHTQKRSPYPAVTLKSQTHSSEEVFDFEILLALATDCIMLILGFFWKR